MKPARKGHTVQLYKIEGEDLLSSWTEHYTELELIDKFWNYALQDELYDSDYNTLTMQIKVQNSAKTIG